MLLCAAWLLACSVKPDPYAGMAALDSLAAGDSEGAQRVIASALAKNPNDALALNWRGRMKIDQLDFSGARDDFSAAIGLDGNLAVAWYNRGNVNIDMGDYDAALRDLGEAARLASGLTGAPYSAGLAKLEMGDYRGAEHAFGIALAQTPMRPATRGRARALSGMGDYGAALQLYDRLLKEFPANIALLFERAGIKESLIDREGALEDYTAAVALAPDLALAYAYRADTYDDLLKDDQAITDWSTALALLPGDYNRHYARGQSYYRSGKYPEAVADWKEAARLRPSEKKKMLVYIKYAEAKMKAQKRASRGRK